MSHSLAELCDDWAQTCRLVFPTSDAVSPGALLSLRVSEASFTVAAGLTQDQHFVLLIVKSSPGLTWAGAPRVSGHLLYVTSTRSPFGETRERDLDQLQKARSFRALVISSRRFRTSQLIHDLYDLFRG